MIGTGDPLVPDYSGMRYLDSTVTRESPFGRKETGSQVMEVLVLFWVGHGSHPQTHFLQGSLFPRGSRWLSPSWTKGWLLTVGTLYLRAEPDVAGAAMVIPPQIKFSSILPWVFISLWIHPIHLEAMWPSHCSKVPSGQGCAGALTG